MLNDNRAVGRGNGPIHISSVANLSVYVLVKDARCKEKRIVASLTNILCIA